MDRQIKTIGSVCFQLSLWDIHKLFITEPVNVAEPICKKRMNDLMSFSNAKKCISYFLVH